MTAGVLLLLIHAAATLYMTGLILFVQAVHYPLFSSVGEADWRAYAERHRRRTTWVVGPPMLVELATAGSLVLWRDAVPGSPPAWSVWAGLGAAVLLWGSTAAVQVPLHRVMEDDFDPRAHRWLVRSNWLRTAVWSGRGVLAMWLLGRAMGG